MRFAPLNKSNALAEQHTGSELAQAVAHRFWPRLLVREGWAKPVSLHQFGNGARVPGWELVEAVQASGSLLEAWHARRMLDRLEYPLPAWEAHPYRTQECVLHLIRRALMSVGLEAPSMPRVVLERRTGGWRVSHGRAA